MSQELDVRIIDMPQLQQQQIRQLIVSCAAEYKITYTADLDAMTKIEDLN